MAVDPARWVVYAAFDEHGRPARHVDAQLSAYRAAGFEVFLVDTSPTVQAERRSGWERLATRWCQRANVGYDFASYRLGLSLLLGERGIDPAAIEVVFTNDSCFGPFMALDEVLARCRPVPRSRRVVFGITDSEEVSPHLQSYWLYVPAGAVDSVRTFFETMPLARDRDEAIRFGELALGTFLRREGIALVALSPVNLVIARFARFRARPLAIAELSLRRWCDRPKYSRKADTACLKWLLGRPTPARDLNATLAFGIDMVKAGMSPFLKRSLLRDNPYQDQRVARADVSRATDNASVAALFGFERS